MKFYSTQQDINNILSHVYQYMNGRHGIHPYWDILDPDIHDPNYTPDRGDWCSALKSGLDDIWELDIIGQDNDILAMYLSLHDMELYGSILTISIEK